MRPGEPPISGDPLIGDLRRAGLLPLLVLHYIAEEACYGNQQHFAAHGEADA